MAYGAQLVSIPRAGFTNPIMELKIESRRPGQWSIHGSRREVSDVCARWRDARWTGGDPRRSIGQFLPLPSRGQQELRAACFPHRKPLTSYR